MPKILPIIAVLGVILFLAAGGICVWSAFHKVKVPIFKVEKLAVSKFSLNDNKSKDDQAVLSTDIDVSMEIVNNDNWLVTTKLSSMVMASSWDEYNFNLGETDMPDIKPLTSGTSSEINLMTHGAADIKMKKKKLSAEDMKLMLTFSGDIQFTWGLFKSKTYPFTITCKDVSTRSKNYNCNSKLYKSAKLVNPAASSTPAGGENIASASSPAAAPTPRPVRDGPAVRLTVEDKSVTLDNGMVSVTMLKPDGFVISMKYNGVENILDAVNPEDDRGYWDVVWATPGTRGTKGIFDRLKASTFRVIVESEDHVEVSFSRKFDIAEANKAAPLDIDLRFVMLRGESGVFSYGIFERQKDWPGCHLPNARLAFKLLRHKFRYMVITDTRQRKMPLPEDRLKGRGIPLEYPEAVLMTNPVDPEFKGEVDDKYQYSDESQNIRVHGWICDDPAMGFWQITPSFEFRSGGPNKQFLTSHVGPSILAMFASAHYTGETVMPKFEEGETWKKVYGPMFMYVNKIEKGENTSLLWEDAKKKMREEVEYWPYSFPASDDFLKANQRSSVSGRFFVHDKVDGAESIPANDSFIGLAVPGEPGSWQKECKSYQFWTKTDGEGRFTIKNVIPGEYNLYSWVKGYIGDYKYDETVKVTLGSNTDLGDLTFEPPRDGPTLWEIGVPDRTAREFFVPAPNPKYVNKLYVHQDTFRQYGLWERYTELYPTNDLVYTVNESDYRKDWFYAQVTRKVNNRYNATTWQIKFNLDDVDQSGTYKLRIAIASTTNSVLEVRVNQPSPGPVIFTSPKLGNDNAIARHGIHGLYWLFHVDVPGKKLKKGENVIYLTQTKCKSPFQGIMYDYLRLEGPAKTASQ